MKKIWVIPDTHGCAYTLQILVENQIQPEPGDLLVFLGDYIDRGPDSKGVIDFIRGLEQKKIEVKCLLGNHEEFCIKTWEADQSRSGLMGLRLKTREQKDWERFGGKATLKSFGVSRPADIPEEYINWMRGLDYFVEVDNFIMVHAGFNFDIEDPFTDTHAMIWIRDYKVRRWKIHNKLLIHGHVPVNLDLIYQSLNSPSGGFIPLDNGIYVTNREGFGNLMALELTQMELISQTRLDEIEYFGE